ncbi:uncharacterized protein [Dysidea avara]|uniref:uncharacterized protein n=1 Tax=Dysidea avara TaxID=196820 RepID=UPI0033231B18
MVKLSLLVITVSLLIFDSLHSVWSIEMANNNTVSEKELLNHSEYCVLNDSAIRKKDGDGLLIIINDTGVWLVATDGSDLFVFPINGSDCEDDDVYNPNIVIYAIQTSIYSVIILVATCIIVLHLYFKELQTVFGIQIILFCFFLNMGNMVTFVRNRYQFTHKVNDSGEVCAVLIYMEGVFTLLSQFTRLTILFQFAYLIYKAYRVRSGRFDTKLKLMLKYVIFIISMTTIYAVIAITCDLAVTRSAFTTENGYCATGFSEDASIILFLVQLASILVMQVVVFVAGMVLYRLVNKRCCEFKSNDARVSLALGSTTGLSIFLFLVIYFADGGNHGIAFLSNSIGTCIQMSILLIIFLTSMKVKTAVSLHSSS